MKRNSGIPAGGWSPIQTPRPEKLPHDPDKFPAGLDMRVVPGLRDALRPGIREPEIEPVEILQPHKTGTPP